MKINILCSLVSWPPLLHCTACLGTLQRTTVRWGGQSNVRPLRPGFGSEPLLVWLQTHSPSPAASVFWAQNSFFHSWYDIELLVWNTKWIGAPIVYFLVLVVWTLVFFNRILFIQMGKKDSNKQGWEIFFLLFVETLGKSSILNDQNVRSQNKNWMAKLSRRIINWHFTLMYGNVFLISWKLPLYFILLTWHST